MLLLLSLALAANAMFAPDSRGYARFNRTCKPSERDLKLAGRAAEGKQIGASEAADKVFYAAERVRQELLAENTKIAAGKLSEQQRRDRRQQADAQRALEAQQIERMRAMNAGVFGARDLGIQRNQEEFNERRIQAEGETLAELTGSALAMGHRVQAATNADAWAAYFQEQMLADRAAEAAEQDMLQLRNRFSRAAHKAAAHAKNIDALGIHAEEQRIAAEKADIKRAGQQARRQRAREARAAAEVTGAVAEDMPVWEPTEEEMERAAAAGAKMYPADHFVNNLNHPYYLQFSAAQRAFWARQAKRNDPTRGMKWVPVKAAEEEAASTRSLSSTPSLEEIIAASPADATAPTAREETHIVGDFAKIEQEDVGAGKPSRGNWWRNCCGM